MPRRSSTARSDNARDFATVARRVVEEAIGEHLDGSPLKSPQTEETPEKNPHAVALGRLGGQKGGRARSKKLSKGERKRIAMMGAKARWQGK